MNEQWGAERTAQVTNEQWDDNERGDNNAGTTNSGGDKQLR
jgi:hypothetical protein